MRTTTQYTREKLAYLYTSALERGDLTALATVLAAAEGDAVLEGILDGINAVYRAELGPPAAHDDLGLEPEEPRAADLADVAEPAAADLERVAQEVAVVEAELAHIIEKTLHMDNVDDPVRLYLREIGQTPLLKADAEADLARAIDAGHVANGQLLSTATAATEIARLLAIRARGLAAKQQMVQANLRLVVSIARRYLGRGLSLLDLIQEGNIGLMRAADKFDYNRGYKFSTYATWWVRQAITRATSDQGRTIRLPVHVSEMVARLRRATHQLQQALQREPTDEELAQALGLSPARVQHFRAIATQPVSLDSPLDDADDSVFGDFIADDQQATPSDAAAHQLLREAVRTVLLHLSERERKIVELRYGLVDGQPRTLEEVAQEFKITRERIRQIETKILRKLRHQRFGGSKLQGYLDD